MIHLYIPAKIESTSYTIADREQLHHLAQVLRSRTGDEISLFDPQGTQYLGILGTITREFAEVSISRIIPGVPAKFTLTVACAVPKGNRFEQVVEKLTELGVEGIWPMQTTRTIVDLKENSAKKLERWRRLALSAAEQSQRNLLPQIPGILTLDDVLQQTRDFSLKLIPTLDGTRRTLSEVTPTSFKGNCVVLIGPEGDFTPEEVQSATQSGFIPVSLGQTVLRVDTAAIAVASYIKMALFA
jgi:16S rRNA (uracil1498-N3)-methyltransferase